MPNNVEETLVDISKQMEGQNLAFEALAELLKKMDNRLEKEEQLRKSHEAREIAKQEAAEEEIAYNRMVKAITVDVAKALNLRKQDQPMADLGVANPKKVSGKTPWPMASNRKLADQEENDVALDDNATEEAQKPIEAMKKQMGIPPKEDEEDKLPVDDVPMEDENMDENGDVGMEEEGIEEEGAEEYPMEEEEGEKEQLPMGKDKEMMMMRKMYKQLQNKVTNIEKSFEESVKKETERRLLKMGYREEKGLARQRLIKPSSIGMDLKKGKAGPMNREEVVDTLKDLSWVELNDLRFKKELGDKSSLPKELLQ